MEIRPLLAAYIPMAHMLAETFGQDCEVVLHDLRDPERSVVYVVNNVVTGRKVGQSFEQLIRQVIFSKELKDDYAANYYFQAPNGKLIRSSTLLIRDEQNALAGALCINLDTSRITAHIELLQSMLPNMTPAAVAPRSDTAEPAEENLHITQMISSLIDNILAGCSPTELSREERLQKIRFMDEKGIFLMKGSVEQVAEKMAITKVTVYSYLDTVRGKRG